MEIQWLEGTKTRRTKADKEVKVYTERKGGRTYTSIVFYNNAVRKITDGDSVSVGLAGGRMYFKSGGASRLCKYPAKNSVIVRLPSERSQYNGKYSMMFDADEKMWFIGA